MRAKTISRGGVSERPLGKRIAAACLAVLLGAGYTASGMLDSGTSLSLFGNVDAYYDEAYKTELRSSYNGTYKAGETYYDFGVLKSKAFYDPSKKIWTEENPNDDNMDSYQYLGWQMYDVKSILDYGSSDGTTDVPNDGKDAKGNDVNTLPYTTTINEQTDNVNQKELTCWQVSTMDPKDRTGYLVCRTDLPEVVSSPLSGTSCFYIAKGVAREGDNSDETVIDWKVRAFSVGPILGQSGDGGRYYTRTWLDPDVLSKKEFTGLSIELPSDQGINGILSPLYKLQNNDAAKMQTELANMWKRGGAELDNPYGNRGANALTTDQIVAGWNSSTKTWDPDKVSWWDLVCSDIYFGEYEFNSDIVYSRGKDTTADKNMRYSTDGSLRFTNLQGDLNLEIKGLSFLAETDLKYVTDSTSGNVTHGHFDIKEYNGSGNSRQAVKNTQFDPAGITGSNLGLNCFMDDDLVKKHNPFVTSVPDLKASSPVASGGDNEIYALWYNAYKSLSSSKDAGCGVRFAHQQSTDFTINMTWRHLAELYNQALGVDVGGGLNVEGFEANLDSYIKWRADGDYDSNMGAVLFKGSFINHILQNHPEYFSSGQTAVDPEKWYAIGEDNITDAYVMHMIEAYCQNCAKLIRGGKQFDGWIFDDTPEQIKARYLAEPTATTTLTDADLNGIMANIEANKAKLKVSSGNGLITIQANGITEDSSYPATPGYSHGFGLHACFTTLMNMADQSTSEKGKVLITNGWQRGSGEISAIRKASPVTGEISGSTAALVDVKTDFYNDDMIKSTKMADQISYKGLDTNSRYAVIAVLMDKEHKRAMMRNGTWDDNAVAKNSLYSNPGESWVTAPDVHLLSNKKDLEKAQAMYMIAVSDSFKPASADGTTTVNFSWNDDFNKCHSSALAVVDLLVKVTDNGYTLVDTHNTDLSDTKQEINMLTHTPEMTTVAYTQVMPAKIDNGLKYYPEGSVNIMYDRIDYSYFPVTGESTEYTVKTSVHDLTIDKWYDLGEQKFTKTSDYDKNYFRGDVDGNGVVDSDDTTLLSRYLADWNVEVDAFQADLDGDGDISMEDIGILQQNVAGWTRNIGRQLSEIYHNGWLDVNFNTADFAPAHDTKEHKYAVTEKIYDAEGNLIAEHDGDKDISQQFVIMGKTSSTDASASGTVKADKDGVIIDSVSYENFVSGKYVVKTSIYDATEGKWYNDLVTTPFECKGGKWIRGDVNGDGVIDSADVTRLSQSFVDAEASYIEQGDLNCDGYCDVDDVMILQKAIADWEVTNQSYSGTLDQPIKVTFDTSDREGHTLVVGQTFYLVRGDKETLYLDHRDEKDSKQTVKVETIDSNPHIETVAFDGNEWDSTKAIPRNRGALTSKTTVVDQITISGFRPGDYVLEGELFDKNAKKVVATATSEKITVVKGQDVDPIEVRFSEFDPTALAGTNKSVAVVERAYALDANGKRSEKPVAEHNVDLNDANQMVAYSVPDLSTKVSKESVTAGKNTTIADELSASDVLPDGSYKVTTTVIDTTNKNTEVYKDTATVEFKSPENATDNFKKTASVDISIDTTKLAGHKLVVFETLTDKNGYVIAKHEDLSDKAQTFTVKDLTIKTTATNKDDGSKTLAVTDKAVIKDVVSYEGLTPGQKYIFVATAHDTEGNAIPGAKAATVEYTVPADSDGSGSVEDKIFVEVDTTKLAGKKVVIFEELYVSSVAPENKIAEHCNPKDEAQTVTVTEAKIGTTASDKATGTKTASVSDKTVIVDTVTYSGLRNGAKYTVTATPYDKVTGKPLNGVEPVTVEFEAKADKKIDVEIAIDTTKLAGKSIVMFESLQSNGVEIAVHNDIKDDKQTVYVPSVGTSAVHSDGTQLITAGKRAEITDTVTYSNLSTGVSYTIEGKIVDKADPKTVVATSTKDLSVDGEGDVASGSAAVEFEFDTTSDMADHSYVCFETIKLGDVVVAEHADVNDRAQTVQVEKAPVLSTTAVSKATENHTAEYSANTVIIDRVNYKNLKAGHKYTVTATPYDKATGEALPGFKPVTESFTADKADGYIDMSITIDTTKLAGKKIVMFESLAEEGIEIAAHNDIEDEAQTVTVPSVATTATGGDAKHDILEDKQVVVVDTVRYTGLVAGETYKMIGRIVDKDAPASVIKTEEVEFTADAENGSVEVKFEINVWDKGNHDFVCFETLKQGELVLAMHEDLNDKDQTVHIVPAPRITTEAKSDATQSHTLERSDKAIVTDRVFYINLNPGTEYTVTATPYDKATKEVLDDVDPVTVKFTPEQADGYVDVDITIDSTKLTGKSIVMFESLKQNDVEVAAHNDITDVKQTVYVPSVKTVATNGDGSHSIKEGLKVNVVDEISYTGLTAGVAYTVEGQLVDKSTGKAVDSVTTSFTPSGSDGTTSVSFMLSTVGMADHDFVCFETIKQGDLIIGEHKDINDASQTVSVTKSKIGTPTSGGGSSTTPSPTPSTSTSSSTPSSSSTPDKTPSNDNPPSTGNGSMMLVYGGISIVSVIALAAFAVICVKKKKESK